MLTTSKTTLGVKYRRGTARGRTDLMGYNWDDSTTDIMPVDAFKTNFRVQYEIAARYNMHFIGCLRLY